MNENNGKKNLLERIAEEMHPGREETEAQLEKTVSTETESPLRSLFARFSFFGMNSFDQQKPRVFSPFGAPPPSRDAGFRAEGSMNEKEPMQQEAIEVYEAKKQFEKHKRKKSRAESLLVGEKASYEKLILERQCLESAIGEVHESLKNARELNKQISEETADKQNSLEKAQKETESETCFLNALKMELQKAVEQLKERDKMKKELERRQALAYRKINSKRGELLGCESAVRELGEQLSMLGKKEYELEEEADEAKKHLEVIRQKTYEKQRNVLELQNEKEKLAKESNEEKLRSEEMSVRESGLKRQRSALQQKIISMKKTIQASERSARELETQLSLLEERGAELSSTFNECKKRQGELKRNTLEKQNVVSSLGQRILEIEGEMQQIDAEAAGATARETSLKERNSLLKRKLRSGIKKSGERECLIARLEEKIASLEKSIPEAEATIAEHGQSAKALEKTLAEKQKIFSELEENKAALKGELQIVEECLNAGIKREASLKKQVANIRLAIRMASEKNDELRKKTFELEQKKNKLEQDSAEAEIRLNESGSIAHEYAEQMRYSSKELEERSAGGGQEIGFLDAETIEFIRSCEFGESFSKSELKRLKECGFKQVSTSNSLAQKIVSRLVSIQGHIRFFIRPRKNSTVGKEFLVWLLAMLLGKRDKSVKVSKGNHDLEFKGKKLSISLSKKKEENRIEVSDSSGAKSFSEKEIDELLDSLV